MDTPSPSEKSLFVQVFDAFWENQQLRRELLACVGDAIEETVPWKSVLDWLFRNAVELLPGEGKRLGEFDFSPLVDFVALYLIEERKPPEIEAVIVDVSLSAQAVVTGMLTLRVPPALPEQEIAKRALAQAGDVAWIYSGTISGTEQVETMRQMGEVFSRRKTSQLEVAPHS